MPAAAALLFAAPGEAVVFAALVAMTVWPLAAAVVADVEFLPAAETRMELMAVVAEASAAVSPDAFVVGSG
jgi:hypothetical protein